MVQIQPEEIIIEALENSGVDAWSTLDSLENVDRVVLINRLSGTIEERSFCLGWITTTYDIDLQCYVDGSQLDAYEFADTVFVIMLEMSDNNHWVDLEFYSIEWLHPLNNRSGASLGIRITTTNGEKNGN